MDVTEQTKEKILVVDDDLFICQLLAEALQNEGYDPLMASHPKEALDISEREDFGLAFVDINLPEMSGLDLASKLKERDSQREVVFITGYGSLSSAVRAIKLGAYDYLRKPFSITEFSLCLKRFQEKKALRKQVKAAENRYFDLVQNIPSLIFVINQDLKLDFVNESCLRMLGFTPDQAIQMDHWLFNRIHPEDRGQVEKVIEAAFASADAPFSAECRMVHRDGHIIHTIFKSIPRVRSNGEASTDQLEGIIVDITDRVLLEEALVQKEKLNTLGAISAEVAHEIRNPLMAIGGFARRLQQKNPDLPEGSIILNESRRLEKVLDRIGNYLKPVEICPQECSVNEVVSQCVDHLVPELNQKEVRWELDLDPGLSTIYVDLEILKEILVNIIRNIMETTESGGDLIAKTFETDQNLHVEFRNKTTAKKVKDADQFLLPFDEGGENVGLPLSYKLLKNIGGLLSCKQERNHMTFTVSLPKMTQRPLPT
ncbi:response regulator [Thermodesulfobacteriota bacterium]